MTRPNHFLLLALAVLIGRTSLACDLTAEKVAENTGAKTTTTPDGVIRIGWPRDDVKVTIDGVAMRPFAGLGSWAAFKKTEHGAMVMGDTVVFQDEVNPAMDAAFANGLEVTALHNHFFYDEPKVYFMHIGGEGCPDELAKGVKAVWDAVKKVRAEKAEPAQSFGSQEVSIGTISAKPLAAIIEAQPASENGMVKFTIGRDAEMHGMQFGGSMGLTTWAAFVGNDSLAAMDGDFAMTANEVQPVLRTLRKAGINVVALHNHMVGESPAYYFVHFWGKGKPSDLAKGFKQAIDAQRQAARDIEATN
ncbi:MAG: DUF1259 domain-containing protein [Pirellulales bacterium]|nr:DUF1259 domain-containing protein [Pirellulales bacterium]